MVGSDNVSCRNPGLVLGIGQSQTFFFITVDFAPCRLGLFQSPTSFSVYSIRDR